MSIGLTVFGAGLSIVLFVAAGALTNAMRVVKIDSYSRGNRRGRRKVSRGNISGRTWIPDGAVWQVVSEACRAYLQ
jgi:hypothetical protein